MLGLFSLDKNPPKTVAAVDLGSNSFHMIVAHIDDGQIHVVDRLREPVRLAAGLDARKNLAEAAQQRALACLERFGQRLRDMPPGSVRAVGTNTLRSAHNTEAFLVAAEKALGHPLEIIAGREEARLIYLGVVHSLAAPPEEQCLVMDIGGGSTEFIIGKGFNTLRRESLYMGCVTMTQTHFGDGQITARALRKAEISARLELQPVAEEFRRHGWQRAIGASGSIKAIGKVLEAEGWASQDITLDALRLLRNRMLELGDSKNLLELKGLTEERIPVFAGGVAILLGAFEELGIARMSISDGALREGLIYDLLGRIRHEDIRAHTISRYQTRYSIDRKQAQRVAHTAEYCLQQVDNAWQLDSSEHQQLLLWAAQLHEIGLIVAHNQYHKHGEYLLRNSDLAGFSRQEQALLATLVRGHRRKFPSSVFELLPPAERHLALHLGILLRLAALLHRSRSLTPLPTLHLETPGAGELCLTFPADWLAQHPLTQADLDNEQLYLAETGFKLRYE